MDDITTSNPERDLARVADWPKGAATPACLPCTEIFVDGCFDNASDRGGWSFVVYRDEMEIASACGGAAKVANNTMELTALLQALEWIVRSGIGEAVTIWSDSVYAVEGCNLRRLIWRTNGWRKPNPTGKLRNRKVADAELWKAVDHLLSAAPPVTVTWCKGHSGIGGNERADELAEHGRLSMPGGRVR